MRTVGTTWTAWAAVVAASWPWTLPAAEEAGNKPVTIQVILERFPPNSSHSWTLPNGGTFGGQGGAMSESITCDSSEVEKAVETAKRYHAEMKEAHRSKERLPAPPCVWRRERRRKAVQVQVHFL